MNEIITTNLVRQRVGFRREGGQFVKYALVNDKLEQGMNDGNNVGMATYSSGQQKPGYL